MSVIDDGGAAAKKPTPPRRTRSKRLGHGRRKITPPNNVQPGWTHRLAAALTVRALHDREIDGGTVDEDMVRLIPGAEDAPEPAELIARIYAHLAWRIPGIRVIAKRLEGTDAKAGVLSDIAALTVQLWLRNRDLFAAARTAQARKLADVARPAASGDEARPITKIFTRHKETTNEGRS